MTAIGEMTRARGDLAQQLAGQFKHAEEGVGERAQTLRLAAGRKKKDEAGALSARMRDWGNYLLIIRNLQFAIQRCDLRIVHGE